MRPGSNAEGATLMHAVNSWSGYQDMGFEVQGRCKG